MKNRKIHILIADDHALMRVGIRSMLESQSAFDVVGECYDGESAVKMAQEIKPDVIIMDLMMPKMNGAEATKAILESNPEIKIIVLTSFGASVEMAKAIQAGAAGALLKESPSEELIKAIFAVMNGETAIHSEVSEYIGELECQPELTQRQLEILTAIAAGNTDKAIADEFKISIAGVRKHILAITSKLGACSRTEAVSIALRKHLLKL
jgi:NarL family two-component system response regulator LiaR